MKKRVQDQLDELRECLNIEKEVLKLKQEDGDEMGVEESLALIASFEYEIARLTGLREVSDAE